MDKVYIYSLEDPETGEIRYVGKANNIKSRFYGHLNEKVVRILTRKIG